MDDALQSETERLTRSWMQHDREMLRDYLVAGVEDPRINVQSILTRHYLTVALTGERFGRLMEQEIRFALAMNWAQSILEKIGGPDDLRVIQHALKAGADNAEGFDIPRFLAVTWAALPTMIDGIPVPNYLDELLAGVSARMAEPKLTEGILTTFQRLWDRVLAEQNPSNLSVIEPACGSANDYRYFEAFGLARLIAYRGFDLCEKNVQNAQALFPNACFAVGNVFAIAAPDLSLDYCIVHDLFEHLSPSGLERGLAEVCRVTRQGLCLGFFNLSEGDEHIIRPLAEYHWNTLSVARLTESLAQNGFSVEVVHLATWLKWRFGCDQMHNQNAYTFFATRRNSQIGSERA